MHHLTRDDLEAGLDQIRGSPASEGVLEWIVCRPRPGERQVLHQGNLDVAEGLVGDSWRTRRSARTADGSPHPGMQLNIMNARVVALLARHRDRWALSGDQLFIDLDLSAANLPAGTALTLGDAVIEVTDQPHAGCGAFATRFGVEAMHFVNSSEGKALRLRGINARVIRSGTIHVGDVARKLPLRQLATIGSPVSL